MKLELKLLEKVIVTVRGGHTFNPVWMPNLVERRGIELIWRLSTGDEGGFLEFYRRHQGGVYRYTVNMTAWREAAADVVRVAFRRVGRDAFARGGNHFLEKLPVFIERNA